MNLLEAADLLTEYAARLDQAAQVQWNNEINPAAEETAALRELAARLAMQGSGRTLHTEDVSLLHDHAGRLRMLNEPLANNEGIADEIRINANRTLGLADRLEELANWIKAGLSRPSAT